MQVIVTPTDLHLDYIEALTDGNFMERMDAPSRRQAMVGGGGIGWPLMMFIGQQKGVNTKMRQYRNFGMANPEGYRKALRLMRLAEKFNRPVVTLIDTPGATLDWKRRNVAKGSHCTQPAGDVSIARAHHPS